MTVLAFLGVTAAALAVAWLLFRKRIALAESKYQEEKTKLETLVHNLPDGVVLANLRGEVLYLNRPAMELLGVRGGADAASQEGLVQVLRHPELRDVVNRITEKHARQEVVEIEVQGPRGASRRYFNPTVTVYSLPHGEKRGILIFLRDVTLDRELTRMKEDFFHAVAHDLRAPIFAVQGYLRLLEKSVEPDPKRKGYFDAIYLSCEKLMLFIQDILDSTRLEAGQLKLTAASVAFRTFLERIHKLFNPVMEEKGIRFELKLSQELPDRIEADARLLERALHNLVANALKFTPKGGEVRLEAARSGARAVEITVADTGPGVPDDRRSVIFEKFTQLETGKDQPGYGLGLHICRQVVELHGGEIWLNSEAGKGAQFTFRIPIHQPSAGPEITGCFF